MMRQLCLVLLAAMAGLGPWIQGVGGLACCRSQAIAAVAGDSGTCCAGHAVELVVVADTGCCHQAPVTPEPQDAPSAGCDCPHAAAQAVPVSAPRFDQVMDRAPGFTLAVALLTPRPARPEAIRHQRAPPPDHAPRAATQYLRSQRLLI